MPCLLGQRTGKKTSLSRNGIGLGRCRMQEPPYHFDIQIALLADRTVAIPHLQFYDLILFCRFY